MSAKSTDILFKEAFEKARLALGLTHYHVEFATLDEDYVYARINREPAECVAKVRYNAALMERDKCAHTVAVHECLHLAIIDLIHACKNAPENVSNLEDERLVRRLEPLVFKALFPNRKG